MIIISLRNSETVKSSFILDDGAKGKPASYITPPADETENNEQILLTSEKKDNIYFYSRNDSDIKEYIIKDSYTIL